LASNHRREGVAKPHSEKEAWGHTGFEECFRDRAAQAAIDPVLLDADHSPSLGSGRREGAGVERFDGVDIYQFHAQSFFLQYLSRFNGFPNHMAAGKNADICSFGKMLCLT